MTPALASVYDALLSFAATEPFAELVADLRAHFTKRVGAFSPSDAWFDERSAALWDRVLTSREILSQMRAAASSAGSSSIFEVHATSTSAVDLVCLACGATFRLAPADDAARGLTSGRAIDDDIAPGAIDAHVVPTAEGVAILPGMLVHPAEATDPIRAIVQRARERGLSEDTLLDALLAMRHRHAALSRMKVKQVYRAEALTTHE